MGTAEKDAESTANGGTANGGPASGANAWRDPDRTQRILDAGRDMGKFVAGGALIAFLLALLAMIEVFTR